MSKIYTHTHRNSRRPAAEQTKTRTRSRTRTSLWFRLQPTVSHIPNTHTHPPSGITHTRTHTQSQQQHTTAPACLCAGVYAIQYTRIRGTHKNKSPPTHRPSHQHPACRHTSGGAVCEQPLKRVRLATQPSRAQPSNETLLAHVWKRRYSGKIEY